MSLCSQVNCFSIVANKFGKHLLGQLKINTNKYFSSHFRNRDSLSLSLFPSIDF